MQQRIYRLQAELCKTLSHPTRLAIIDHCKDGEKSVTELLELIGVGKANLSQHLALLRQKHITVTRREGANVYHRIAHWKIITVCNIIREILTEQLVEYGKMHQYIDGLHTQREE